MVKKEGELQEVVIRAIEPLIGLNFIFTDENKERLRRRTKRFLYKFYYKDNSFVFKKDKNIR